MLIGKSNGGEAFRRYVDAQSRVAVWMANHASSPQISKLGLTHIPGGAADAFGAKMLRADGPGLVLVKIEPVQVSGLITWAMPMQPMIPQRNFVGIAPFEIPQALNELCPMCDPVYAAEELGVLCRDMDKVSGPKLCREFVEPVAPAPWGPNMPCFDANGIFKGRYILFSGAVYEVKWFKYCDSPACGYLLFAPRESAIYVPHGCTGVFSADANIALNNHGIGWIGTAGGTDKLDLRIIKRYGEKAGIVWAEFPDDPLLSKNNFASAFAIATEAKRRGTAMKILRATATAYRPDGCLDAQEHLLDDREVKKLARQFKLKIDPVWNGFPGEIDFDDEPQVRKVPPFWDGNRVAAFYGPDSVEFMFEVLTPRLTPWISCGWALAVVDEKDNLLLRMIREASGGAVRVATFEVFKDHDAFIEKVPQAIDMVFVVPPRDEKKFSAQVVDELCALAGLPVGIFSRSEDAPPQRADTVNYYVAKHPSTDGVFCVKNMNINTITKYMFSPSGVEVTPGREDETIKE